MAGISASAAAEFYDEAYDDVRPEDDDWASVGVVGGRTTPRWLNPAGDADDPGRASGSVVGGGSWDGDPRGPVLSAVGGAAAGAGRGAGGQGASGQGAGGVRAGGSGWGSAAGLQVVRTAGLSDVVRTASGHGAREMGSARTLPVLSGLRALLPGGGLRRGATIAVHTSSVLLALLAAASRAGSWCAVVGLPALSPIAAAEMGIALERLALVPHPGTEWTTIVAALLDGVDIVVAAPPGPVAPVVAGRLAARARQRGSVLMPAGAWTGADLTVAPVRGEWGGLGAGRGRLRCREMTIQARGRGAATAPREVTLWLPALEGVLPPVTRALPAAVADPLPPVRALPAAVAGPLSPVRALPPAASAVTPIVPAPAPTASVRAPAAAPAASAVTPIALTAAPAATAAVPIGPAVVPAGGEWTREAVDEESRGGVAAGREPVDGAGGLRRAG